ncbi:MAG: tRNA uridine-5-carboxymethylaminomethyl(34) synthesis GTPase MnmE, partial [Planctomycetes bacterium]|nr:tRNA uridine-5-carboxymethylaminomethyl(34) synthesis GTPase MnmE [Planctomycetota bacterium]
MFTSTNDTIAAISTAPGPALRAVVRISGPEALSLAGRLIKEGSSPANLPGFSAPRVLLRLSGEGTLQARMIVMHAPRSYTTEDVVEFHIIGAQTLVESVFQRCLKEGARPAGPGEFTQRAYLGGRIDATQVEGVLHLIESRSDSERKSALRLLQGRVSAEAHAVQESLAEALVAIEAYLDFTDEDTESLDRETVRQGLSRCLEGMDRIEETLSRRDSSRNLPSLVLLG